MILMDLLKTAARENGIQHVGLMPKQDIEIVRQKKRVYQQNYSNRKRDRRRNEIRKAILELNGSSEIELKSLADKILDHPDEYPNLCKSSRYSIGLRIGKYCSIQGFRKIRTQPSAVYQIPEGWR